MAASFHSYWQQLSARMRRSQLCVSITPAWEQKRMQNLNVSHVCLYDLGIRAVTREFTTFFHLDPSEAK